METTHEKRVVENSDPMREWEVVRGEIEGGLLRFDRGATDETWE